MYIDSSKEKVTMARYVQHIAGIYCEKKYLQITILFSEEIVTVFDSITTVASYLYRVLCMAKLSKGKL